MLSRDYISSSFLFFITSYVKQGTVTHKQLEILTNVSHLSVFYSTIYIQKMYLNCLDVVEPYFSSDVKKREERGRNI